ncbi:2-nitropropane dioxygenase [Microbacterium saccharophilum]|uniref:Propionate 3-nitronate monooxygenase n=1 Tax=Microbacterium saccharophilum TaxID=1213358 RepID=A0A5C8I863_9MICO|nr:nitronate monooxygenase [Microbacterium saccharophilum]TXK14880.1 2-nitropropane dioxygenase [Microbacterium saccharophilum]GEP47268.1 oxidoreductase [Microbacterium saccharophilum]
MALLGLDVPIVLGPFGGMSSVALTAAVSDAGGLGSYGLYGYPPARIAETARLLREATDRPFALNLWMPVGDEAGPGTVDTRAAQRAVAPLYEELGVPAPAGTPERFVPDVAEQLDAVLAARPAVLSCVFGMPPVAVVEAARSRGIRIVGAATTVAEAIAVTAAGADAVVASGFEAGGHRVSFMKPAEQSLVGTFALLPQVVDAVDIPVIAAGGIADRRGVAAAFALGAAGVQVGTAFLGTRQSAASAAHRAALRGLAADDTVLTRAVTGRLARGIRNRLVAHVEAADAIAPFPAQSWVVGALRAEANRRGDGDLQSLWAGQSAALTRFDDAAEVFAELAAGLPR